MFRALNETMTISMTTEALHLRIHATAESRHRLYSNIGKCHASVMIRARGFRTTEMPTSDPIVITIFLVVLLKWS